MGFLSNLFKSKPDAHKKQLPPSVQAYSSERFDFEDEYEQELEYWELKIDNAKYTTSDNPKMRIAAYDKALALCSEFKEFCNSCGAGGTSYFLEHGEDLRESIEKELQDYLDNEYEQDLNYYQQSQEEKRKHTAVKAKVLTFVKKNDGVMRKDIYAQFDTEQKALVLKALNSLVGDGKVNKAKEGDRLVFRAK